MHKCISQKCTLSLPFSLTCIPWPWITPPLSCENVGRLPYLSEPHFFVKWGSHVFGSGVALERRMNFPGSWLRTCQEAGVHWKRSDLSTSCSFLPTSRSQSRFLRGTFPAVLLGVGHPDANHSPVFCLLPGCVSSMQETATGLFDCLSSPGRTHSPSILHELCAFTEDLVQKRAEEVCLAQFSTGTRPNQTHKTKHRNSHQTLLIFIVFTWQSHSWGCCLFWSFLLWCRAQSCCFLPKNNANSFSCLMSRNFLKFIYLAVPDLSCSTWGLCGIFHLLCSMQDSSSLTRDWTWTPYLGIMAF